MESDQLSEKSFSSLNTLNLQTHTKKERFAVNKDDTVQFYLSTLRGDYDTRTAPDLVPLLDDPPKQPKKAAAAKSGRRRKGNKENQLPPSSSEPGADARAPAESTGGARKLAAVAAGELPPPSAERVMDCGDADPLHWFRSRSKPTVEEEFEEFKKRFVWNGSRLTSSAASLRGRRDGSGGEISAAAMAGKASSAFAAPASTDADERSPVTAEGDGLVRGISLTATAAVSSSASPATLVARQLSRPASKNPAVARRRSFRDKALEALEPLPPPTPPRPPEPRRQPTAGAKDPPRHHAEAASLEVSPFGRSSQDQSVQTNEAAAAHASRVGGASVASPGGDATPESDARSKRERQRRCETRGHPHSMSLAVVATAAADRQPPLRLPPLDATAAAAELRGEHDAGRARASSRDGGSAVASVDRSKLAAIKSRAKARTPRAEAGRSSVTGEEREEEEEEEDEECKDGASMAVPIAAKMELIKLLAREKRKRQQKKKHLRAEAAATAAAAAVRQQLPQSQMQQQPALWHELDDAGRARVRKRKGALPPMASRQSVDLRCASEVAALRRTAAADFGETESRICVSEVHPGRVPSFSMNFDAYVRAMEKMVDATLNTLAQAELY